MTAPRYVPLDFQERPDMRERAVAFRAAMSRRRTVREFSDRPVDREVIDHCLLVAGSAPSGANLQPWHFVVVSDTAIKTQIRDGAEKEERELYHGRAPQAWLDALAPLGTDGFPQRDSQPPAQRETVSAAGGRPSD